MLRRRLKRDNSTNNSLPWLLTYSDMVTLCLTFFILLYSFSTLDNIKFKHLVVSLQGALGPFSQQSGTGERTPVQETGRKESESAPDRRQLEEFQKYRQDQMKLERVQTQINEYLMGRGAAGNVAINLEERGLVLRFEDSVLFQKGKADLLQESTVILKKVASVLQEIDNPIRIEGHTDNLPIRTERFPSNWELSTARATNVLRFFISEGLPGKRLSAVGYGEYYPLAENNNEENRQKNRRVDVVIIRESLRIREPR